MTALEIAEELQTMLVFSDGRFGSEYENQNPSNTILRSFLNRDVIDAISKSFIALSAQIEHQKQELENVYSYNLSMVDAMAKQSDAMSEAERIMRLHASNGSPSACNWLEKYGGKK